MSASNWQAFFEDHAAVYDTNCFTKNTLFEVDFLLEELRVAPGARILDVGCGTGRHSIELARRGYRMTGLDLTPAMLAQARAKAQAAGVHVDWVQGDATRFAFAEPFDAAICLCEGSFGLLGAGDDALEHPQAILANVSRSLRAGARTVFTVLSALRMVRRHSQQDVEQGAFDPLTLTEASECTVAGAGAPLHLRERGFVATELVLLFRIAGLAALTIWGGTAGNWNRLAIDLDEFEIMLVARKTSEPHAWYQAL